MKANNIKLSLHYPSQLNLLYSTFNCCYSNIVISLNGSKMLQISLIPLIHCFIEAKEDTEQRYLD